MINSRIHNQKVNTGIRNEYPNVRVSNFQTTRSGEQVTGIVAGMPMGLLLALTYATSAGGESLPFFGDYRPTVRIANN